MNSDDGRKLLAFAELHTHSPSKLFARKAGILRLNGRPFGFTKQLIFLPKLSWLQWMGLSLH